MYIIIVTYNNFDDTLECLESILKNNNDYQIIIVDNSESNDSYNKIKTWSLGEINTIETQFNSMIYPLEKKPIDLISINEVNLLDKKIENKIILVKANQNQGFSAANNIALKYILKHEPLNPLIWLLNNDTVIEKDTIDKIYKETNTFKRVKDHIIFGTPLMHYYEPTLIQAIGGRYNYLTGNSKIVDDNITLNEYTFDQEVKVDFPIGASMIITKNNLLKIGLLCEDYFLYFEELDWCFRLKKLGGVVKILNIFTVYHKQGSTTNAKYKNKNSEFIDLIYLKAKMKFASKFNKKYSLTVWMYTFFLSTFKRLLQGDFTRAFLFFKILIKKKY